jgi:hypothetical protein
MISAARDSIDKRSSMPYRTAHHVSEHIQLTWMNVPFVGHGFSVARCPASRKAGSETRITKVFTSLSRQTHVCPATVVLVRQQVALTTSLSFRMPQERTGRIIARHSA